ncbi:MAG: 3-deoxy-7-phosphoheptulonate synthase [Capsulimonadaceae bacterium]|nr:3-deoxy-7-phosphoheptulonate synthase [Capsulimonadaceae bacterium]
MIIVMSSKATPENLEELTGVLKERGYDAHLSKGVETTIVGAVGALPSAEEKAAFMEQLETLPYVDRVVPVAKPYKLVNKQFHPEPTVIDVRGVRIGDPAKVIVMAGPCTVETPEQLHASAQAVKAAGAHILRGGAFKPSTSPYSFHGHGEAALKMLAESREEFGIPIITEVMDVRDVELVCKYADILQIGTRNMANFTLLKEVGDAKVPVMLKRGMAALYEEYLQAAEYIASRGNYEIMLCERGVRTFETYTRNTFDINAIPAWKELSHLPVIADPSHATGKASLVAPVTKAAVAAGADGVIIEVHPYPSRALKDGAQSLEPEAFARLVRELEPVAQSVGRTIR